MMKDKGVSTRRIIGVIVLIFEMCIERSNESGSSLHCGEWKIVVEMADKSTGIPDTS